MISGCGSLYKVSNNSSSKGIPFFKQQILETTTAIYEENFFQIELELKWEEKQGTTQNVKKKNVKTKTTGDKKTQFVTKAIKYSSIECGYFLNTLFSSSSTIKDAYDAVRGQLLLSPSAELIKSNCKYWNIPFDKKELSELLETDSNAQNKINTVNISLIKTRKTVPNPEPIYINVKKPFSGSAEAAITLNENGTLSAATSKVQDDLVGKIVDKLPITEAVSSFIGIPDNTESESVENESARLIGLKLTLIPIKRTYEVSSESFLDKNSTGVTAPTKANYTSFKINESKGTLLSEKEKKTDEGQTIKLNGSLTIPKKSE